MVARWMLALAILTSACTDRQEPSDAAALARQSPASMLAPELAPPTPGADWAGLPGLDGALGTRLRPIAGWLAADAGDDDDGDGWPNGADCDDTRPSVFPGAWDPVDDGVDQDCSGERNCLSDDDRDGWSDGVIVRSTDASCNGTGATPLTTPIGDCADRAASIHPGAQDPVDDGIDQDCSGVRSCLSDDDDDGWSDGPELSSTNAACNGPGEAPLTSPEGDCDDNARSTYPGASDPVDDAIDQDCSGTRLCRSDDDRDGWSDGEEVVTTNQSCNGPGEVPLTSPAGDCNDAAASIYPGATDPTGDNVDQDCSGPRECLSDDDDDGWSDGPRLTTTDQSCNGPGQAPLTAPIGDCNDASASVYPGANDPTNDNIDQDCSGSRRCLSDDDRDGWSDGVEITTTNVSCNGTGQTMPTAPIGDCNDGNASIYPGANDPTGDTIDQDCSGSRTCLSDDDRDGWSDGVVLTSTNASCNGTGEAMPTAPQGDCNDRSASTYPGASDPANDGIDQDCSGTRSCGTDRDRDGWGTGVLRDSTNASCNGTDETPLTTPVGDCNDNAQSIYPGASDPVDDGVDQDCSGSRQCLSDDDRDGWSDGVLVTSTNNSCNGPGELPRTAYQGDCNDESASTYPGAHDPEGDGVDQSCSDARPCLRDNDGDGWSDGTVVSPPGGVCSGRGYVGYGSPSGDCNDNAASIYPGASDPPDDGIDQDCSGNRTCYSDDDRDGWSDGVSFTSTNQSCNGPGETSHANYRGDCNDNVSSIYPGAYDPPDDELDQDCSGVRTCFSDDDNDGWVEGDSFESTNQGCDGPGEAPTNAYGGDCNDADPSVYPSAHDPVDDGIDQDCSGSRLCAIDEDGDGWGISENVTTTNAQCNGPGERALTAQRGDCDDNNASYYPGASDPVDDGLDQDCSGRRVCLSDDDRDGWSDGVVLESTNQSCNGAGETMPTTYQGDCDDSNNAFYPGASDPTSDGIDQDCSGTRNCLSDDDRDGWSDGVILESTNASCNGPGETALTTYQGDCNDESSSTYPGAYDPVDDELDQDCSGPRDCLSDDDRDGWSDGDIVRSTNQSCNGPGEIALTTYQGDCNDANASTYPGAYDPADDGLDQDCSGPTTCLSDDDRDGWSDGVRVASTNASCNGPGETSLWAHSGDCDDTSSAIYPGAYDPVDDGLDQDCSSIVHTCLADHDNDGYTDGNPTPSLDWDCNGLGELPSWAPRGDCDDEDPAFNPGADDPPDDGIDQDCSGAGSCLVDADGDGWSSGAEVVTTNPACDNPGEAPLGSPVGDCDDEDAQRYPGAEELPDGVDQDCSGLITCAVDADGDGWAAGTADTDGDCTWPGLAPVGTPDGDCDDAAPGVNPGATEVLSDGIDNDCNPVLACSVDADGDGWATNQRRNSADDDCDDGDEGHPLLPIGDCDDANNQINPGELETPDGVDEDCSGFTTCAIDADGDGWAAGLTQTDGDCSWPGLGVTTLPAGDCDDEDASVNPGKVDQPGDGMDDDCAPGLRCLADDDQDGFAGDGLVASTDDDCDDPGELAPDAPRDDCDDGDALTHPGATDTPGDGQDQDCSGDFACWADDDNDGWTGPQIVASPDAACDAPGEADTLSDPTDCDDTDPSVHPGAPDPADDDLDQNCTAEFLCGADRDQDGWGDGTLTSSADADCDDPGEVEAGATGDCDDVDPSRNPDAADIAGDGVDRDCSGDWACLSDRDGDGYSDGTLAPSSDADCADAGEAPAATPLGDCDDADASRHPGRTDSPGDNIDQDCDGLNTCFTDADGDGFTVPGATPSTDADCADAGEAAAASATIDCDDDDANTRPGGDDVPGDDVDQDCDGRTTCLVDLDGDGFAGDGGIPSVDADCQDLGELRVGAPTGDCDDLDPATNPAATDIAGDAFDQDCSGIWACLADGDRDGFGGTRTLASLDADCADAGEAWLAAGLDCDDADAARNPGAEERVGNDFDEDCDGRIECFVDHDGDGYAADDATMTSADADCAGPGEADDAQPAGDCDDDAADVSPGATDVANDGIDQDCDGVDAVETDEPTDTDSTDDEVPDTDVPVDDVTKQPGECSCQNGARFPAAAWLVAAAALLRRRRAT